MRVLIFHGYLLRGTGSNIYNASLARALTDLGHEVHLLCQDREAGELPFVDAMGTWEGDALRVETLREPVRCTVYLPDIGRVLPVYVADAYDHFDAVPFADLDDAGVARYLDANVAAVGQVADRAGVDVALANHLVAGPAILARAIGGRVPYAVKIHGSALEYVVRPHPDRFLPLAREGCGKRAACWWARGTPLRASGRFWQTRSFPRAPAWAARRGRAHLPPASARRGRGAPERAGGAARGRRGDGLGRGARRG